MRGHLDDSSAFLAGLHLYVQTSLQEGLCIAAHEAMAAGLPIVATPAGKLRFSVRDHITGHHIGFGSADALADRMAELDRDPDRAHALGLAGREFVCNHFSAEKFAAAPHRIPARLNRVCFR